MSEGGARPVVPGLSLLFRVASGLVVVAAVQLFVLSDHTDRFFAWTIAQPLTAAADGAFYLAAVALLVPAARARTWEEVRPIAWGVLTVSTLKLAATLLHLGPFRLDEGGTPARIAAWGWLAVYAAVPVALGALIVAELRAQGSSPRRLAPMPGPLRLFSGALSVVLMSVGVALFLTPGAMAERWPWPLTDLTARALAAWFVGIGVIGCLAVLEGDRGRTRPVWIASVSLAMLQAVALARYPDAVAWGSAASWLYVAMFACVGGAGAWGWSLSRRPVAAPFEAATS